MSNLGWERTRKNRRVLYLAHSGIVNHPGVRRGPRHDKLGAEQGRVLLHAVIVDDARLLVQPVRKGFKEDGDGRDLLGVGLVAVGQVAPVRQVQGHDAVVRLEHGRVRLEVGGRARQGLHVHAPLGRVQVKGLQGALLAKGLHLVDVLVAAVVAGPGVPFRVLVGHDRAQSVKHRPTHAE